MSQSQSSQTSDIVSQDVFNQLLEMLDQSSFHSVQPIELNFSDSPTDGSAANTIQISMDCITMRGPEDPFSVSTRPFQPGVLLILDNSSDQLSVEDVKGDSRSAERDSRTVHTSKAKFPQHDCEWADTGI
ncbi:hypothetical protein COCON_G00065150 [Conger conger]|uniref:Uncharacterized protein n=1 Tax=Conger conger TaxID=82655 RepID=A0A9Q1DSQ9_CONCO|nr:hypothetical protein COCON_G00065150 [Conger conger]